MRKNRLNKFIAANSGLLPIKKKLKCLLSFNYKDAAKYDKKTI